MFKQPLIDGTELLASLPVAVYTTDADGNITFYNEAAAAFWGHRPELGSARWCGSWRLFWPDGRPLAHGDCPMAVTLKEGREVRGAEAVAERPDGTRVPFIPYPTLLRDQAGQVVGAINLLVDIGERKTAEIESERLAAIVSSSDDAIVSKTLDGVITSWNAGATRIFGYEADEIIGQSVLRIIPTELQYQEADILAKLRRGERIDHFDTVRVAKDGSRVDVSLTVSPLRDRSGTIVGASKVARDITERKRNEALQSLLFDELNHRVKNTLAMVQAIASQSLRRAAHPEDFVASFSGRVQALARAHDLLVQSKMQGAEVANLVREQVLLGELDGSRVSVSGPRLLLDAAVAIQLALVLHELATNARKYGALSVRTGRLSIGWSLQTGAKRQLLLEWRESGVPGVTAPSARGFGTTLIERSLEANGGEANVRYGLDGLVCEICLPLAESVGELQPAGHHQVQQLQAHGQTAALHGRRILIVEDEPLIAMELETELMAAGCEVVGPAATVAQALQFVAETKFDIALVDLNLGGCPADAVAAALVQKGIPFTFTTGYGQPGLSPAFQGAPVLTKPYHIEKVLSTIGRLLDGDRRVVQFRPRQL